MHLKSCSPAEGQLPVNSFELYEPAAADGQLFHELARHSMPDGMHTSPTTRFALSDVMLIVIGFGGEAEELCRRRLAAGGHLCALRTDRPPNGAVVSSGCFWIPPACDRRRWDRTGALRLTKARRAAEAAQTRCAWESVNLGTEGPDVHVLAPDEDYALIYDEAMGFTGVCVMDGDGELLWALSGKVVFAGKAIAFPGGVCDTMDGARAEDVSVRDEEAKAFSVPRKTWVAVWSLLYATGVVLVLALGAHFEPRFGGAGPPLWRVAYAFTVPALSVGGFDRTLAKAFTGTELLPGGARAEIPFVFLVCALSFLFFVDTGGATYTFSAYVAMALTVVGSFPPLLIVSLLTGRFTESVRRSFAEGSWAWMRQAWWGMWVACGTFGSWLAFYGVAMVFVFAVPVYPTAASFCLPLLTGSVEAALIAAGSLVYDLALGGSAGEGQTFRGDQRMLFLSPLFLAHSFAESQKLCSLISAGVKEPGNGWIVSLATGLASNLLSRSDFARAVVARASPAWFTRNVLVLGVSRLIQSRLRYSIGYPRFVVPFAIVVVRMVQGKEGVLFNGTALAVLLSSLATEAIEDFVMMRQWLPVNSWALELEPFYREIRSESAYQVLHFDCRGRATGCARHLRNLRHLDFVRTGGLMSPVVLFPLCLLQLLLGPGYVYGMCEAPLDNAKLFATALIWEAPLSCS